MFHDVPCMCPSLSMPIYIWLNLSLGQQRARSSVLLRFFQTTLMSETPPLRLPGPDWSWTPGEGSTQASEISLSSNCTEEVLCQKHLKHRALPKLKCLQTKSLEGKWDAMTANMETAWNSQMPATACRAGCFWWSKSLQGFMSSISLHITTRFCMLDVHNCPTALPHWGSLWQFFAAQTPLHSSQWSTLTKIWVQNTSKTLLVVPNSQWSIWRVGTCSSCEWSTACTTWARMRIPSGPSCTCHHHQIRWHEPWAYLLRHILSKSFDRTLRCPEQTTYSFISHHTSIWKHSREVQVRMCERANVACEPAAPARLLAWAKRPQDTDQTTPSTLNIKTWATLEMVPTNYLKQCWKNACRS